MILEVGLPLIADPSCPSYVDGILDTLYVSVDA